MSKFRRSFILSVGDCKNAFLGIISAFLIFSLDESGKNQYKFTVISILLLCLISKIMSANSANHVDNTLLERCLARQNRAWEDFVDRFLGLVLHVIDHTVCKREIQIQTEERHVMCERVFAALAHDQCRLLREYKAHSSLTTYLSVIVRRIVVRSLLNQSHGAERVTFRG